MEEVKKFYSQKSIAFATYLGGPLAAGILIRRNCLNLDKEKQGINALLIGIISTILIFVGIFLIPEHIIDKIPSFLIPLIYTGIIYLIVDKIQGDELKLHKENNREFYSVWKAAGIGAVSLIIILGGVFGYVFLEPDDWDVDSYDAKLEVFNNNEEDAMQLFDMLEKDSKHAIVYFIENTGIPKWKENIEILKDMSEIENIPEEFQKQNRLLIEYSELRIEAYELMGKAVLNETSEYDDEILKRHARIDEIIDEL